MKKHLFFLLFLAVFCQVSAGQDKSLHRLQQEFVDLRFGMFVHFGLPTYQGADWTDPNTSPDVFIPSRLDTDQWVRTAKDVVLEGVLPD